MIGKVTRARSRSAQVVKQLNRIAIGLGAPFGCVAESTAAAQMSSMPEPEGARVLGRRLQMISGGNDWSLTLGSHAVRVEQLCRVSLARAWPDYASFVRHHLTKDVWTVQEVAHVAEMLEQISADVGIAALAGRVSASAQGDVLQEQAQQVWTSFTAFFVRAAALNASVADNVIPVPEHVFVELHVPTE